MDGEPLQKIYPLLSQGADLPDNPPQNVYNSTVFNPNMMGGSNLPEPMRPTPSEVQHLPKQSSGELFRPPEYQPSAPQLPVDTDLSAGEARVSLPHLTLNAPSLLSRTHQHQQHHEAVDYQMDQLQILQQQQIPPQQTLIQQMQPQQHQLPQQMPPQQRQPQQHTLAHMQAQQTPQQQLGMQPGQSLLINFDASQESREPEEIVNFQWHISPKELTFERELARGTFGSVHAGHFRRTPVAIKQLHGSALTAQQHLDFRAEIGILMRLHHPNIVLFLGFTQDDTTRQYYMIFEFMERGTVWDLVHKSGKPIKFDLIVSILSDAATGMFYLHSMNPPIIHRDFKSPNLLLDRAYRCKLADFGLSRTKRHLGQKMTSQIGTFQYMAPEVIQGQPYGEPADVFSFGLVMWEMLSGTQPYPNLDNMQVAYQCVAGIRPAIPRGVPEAMARLIEACWQSNPELRPSYGFILDQLAAFI